MDGQTYGWMDRRVGGWTDGMDGQANGWMDDHEKSLLYWLIYAYLNIPSNHEDLVDGWVNLKIKYLLWIYTSYVISSSDHFV